MKIYILRWDNTITTHGGHGLVTKKCFTTKSEAEKAKEKCGEEYALRHPWWKNCGKEIEEFGKFYSRYIEVTELEVYQFE